MIRYKVQSTSIIQNLSDKQIPKVIYKNIGLMISTKPTMQRKQNFLLSFLTFSETFYNYHVKKGRWKSKFPVSNSFNTEKFRYVTRGHTENYHFSNIVNPLKWQWIRGNVQSRNSLLTGSPKCYSNHPVPDQFVLSLTDPD